MDVQMILKTSIAAEGFVAILKCAPKRFIARVRIDMCKHFVGVAEHSIAVRIVAVKVSLLTEAVVRQHDVQGELVRLRDVSVHVLDVLCKILAWDGCHFMCWVDIIFL